MTIAPAGDAGGSTTNGAATMDDAAAAPPSDGAAAPPPAAAAPPRAKINLSLKKKSNKSKSAKKASSHSNVSLVGGARKLLGEEYSTIAEEAEAVSRRRREEGTLLVIPCGQRGNNKAGGGGDEAGKEGGRTRPLLAGRLELLRRGDDGGAEGAGGAGAPGKKDDGDDGTNGKIETAEPKRNDATSDAKNGDAADDEDAAVRQLIRSARGEDGDEADRSGGGKRGPGLVIAAPSENHRIDDKTAGKVAPAATTADEPFRMNDEEVFQKELAHHADDVAPTSDAYAKVAIGDFGSALLRGMGWAGGDNNQKNGEEEVKPRPHRLGLGARPLLPPPPSSGGPGGSRGGRGGGIHRRARRPEEVRRDEERERRIKEEERREAERRRRDVQHNLQPGSVVRVSVGDGAPPRRREDGRKPPRARLVKTAGVPGLNMVLIQMEGSDEAIPAKKRTIELCSWEELEEYPFKGVPLRTGAEERGHGSGKVAPAGSGERVGGRDEERQVGALAPRERNGGGRGEDGRGDDRRQERGRSGSRSDENGDDRRKRRDRKKRERDRQHYDDGSSDDGGRDRRRRRSGKDKRKKKRRRHRDDDGYDDRSRSRSRSRERRGRSRSDSRERRNGRSRSDSRGRDDGRGGKDSSGRRRRDDARRGSRWEERGRRDPRRSDGKERSERPAPRDAPPEQQHLNWLIPHIRVRLVSKKMPRYHLRKGVVQDIVRTHRRSSSGGPGAPKAVLLMDDGRVIDEVPERYLETALPKLGHGNSNNVVILEGEHRWKRGRLLERESSWGIVQLEEDLEVVRVPLDAVAEWCGGVDVDG